jgi:hypothetical protein
MPEIRASFSRSSGSAASDYQPPGCRIIAIRGSFDRYDGKTIVMTGGEHIAADVAILAIGFELGVPFLPEACRNKLVL